MLQLVQPGLRYCTGNGFERGLAGRFCLGLVRRSIRVEGEADLQRRDRLEMASGMLQLIQAGLKCCKRIGLAGGV